MAGEHKTLRSCTHAQLSLFTHTEIETQEACGFTGTSQTPSRADLILNTLIHLEGAVSRSGSRSDILEVAPPMILVLKAERVGNLIKLTWGETPI